ncbi:MAG: 1-deoxy-D-xylulose-5-phosphate synthase [Elusimicrobiota bacterium]
MSTKILEKIDKPGDLRILRRELLLELAEEIRTEITETVSKTGGHLASSLGAVELIIALHYVFDMPGDKIIFDVGHQAYAHKLLTGRRKKFSSLRQPGGISGFPSIDESEYDVFGTGHSSTAISAACGFAVARDLSKQDFKVVAVIGDGSMTGGLAFEGLNNAGHLNTSLLIILNDNEMFISHRVGAIASYLARILTLGLVKQIEKRIESFLRRIQYVGLYLLRLAKRFKLLLFPGMLFEEMGFAYYGPVDGHDLYSLIDILGKLKNIPGPILLHILTKKGKGYHPAEKDPIKFHGIAKFEVETGNSVKFEGAKEIPTYTDIFSKTIVDLAKQNEKIIAITAAMPEGTGLEVFRKEFPYRFFDVGIAEQHSLTFAASAAAAGLKPVCAIYSTFLQRGYDQLIHDIAIQKLPVVITVDRAGIVGEDGKTHQGVFDISFLRPVPNLIIMSPKDENELRDMLYTALNSNYPSIIRYPRGKCSGVQLKEKYELLKIGSSELLKDGTDLCFIAIGNMVSVALQAADNLTQKGISCAVLNARFIKPLDVEALKEISKKINRFVTLEENVLAGGFGSAVREFFAEIDALKILSIGLPDNFIEHGSQEHLRKKYGLTPEAVSEKVKDWFT